MSDPSPLISSTAKMEAVIRMLTLLIKVGKNLPLIVLSFAMLNLTLAILDFFYWNHVASAIFNSILAVGGFNFFVQLVRRRKIHSYDFPYAGRERRALKVEDQKLAAKTGTAAAA